MKRSFTRYLGECFVVSVATSAGYFAWRLLERKIVKKMEAERINKKDPIGFK